MPLNFDGGSLATKEKRDRLVQGLGWFSIGLGLAEVLAPRMVCRLIGVRPRAGLLRFLGLRELTSGVGLLTQGKATWLKARVGGDAMDLGLLGLAVLDKDSEGGRLALASTAVAGVTAIDYLMSQECEPRPESHTPEFAEHPAVIQVRRSIIVDRPAELLYQTWGNFRELPRFMRNVLAVEERGDRRWHWICRGPAGSRLEWDAEITEDRSNELIAWRSLPGADVDHAGCVRFEPAPGGRGTLVRVEMRYRPPIGKTGAIITKLLGTSPEAQIAGDLRRFKQMLETGEVARTTGQPAGRTRSTSRVFDDLVRA